MGVTTFNSGCSTISISPAEALNAVGLDPGLHSIDMSQVDKPLMVAVNGQLSAWLLADRTGLVVRRCNSVCYNSRRLWGELDFIRGDLKPCPKPCAKHVPSSRITSNSVKWPAFLGFVQTRPEVRCIRSHTRV